jgi:proteasome lid subunit RPN8/RPN11
MTIVSSVLNDVLAHARSCQPLECCGVLLGQADRITRAVRARNVAESPTRFVLDPKDHIDARRTARAERLDVLGFYHSHPRARPVPSPTDLSEAAYPECVHLIVGFVEGEPEIRIFHYADGRATELPQTIVDAMASHETRNRTP